MRDKKNLLNLKYEKLEKFCLELGFKKFNVKQIYSWIHEKNIKDIDEMTNLSKKNREILKENAYIPLLKILNHQVSKIDRTEKYLFELEDGKMIETVLMRHDNRNTVCVSSQVGCAVKCTFCATGIGGFKRDLNVSEILGQIYEINRRLKTEDQKVRNIVFMGMGEPLLNLDEVLPTLEMLIDEKGLNLSKRRITISTSGIIPKIEELIEKDLTVELALSLHAPTDEIRNKIIPINERYPVKALIDVLKKYYKASNRKITLEYILIDKLNDSFEEADQLAKLIKGFEYVINIIPYNPVEGFTHERPSKTRIDKFYKYMRDVKKLNVTLRGEKGTDIDGACGQLRQKKKKTELKFEDGELNQEMHIHIEK